MIILIFFLLLRNNVYESVQIATFKAQLQLAYETKKPLVIHCRDFELEVYQIMKKVNSFDLNNVIIS